MCMINISVAMGGSRFSSKYLNKLLEVKKSINAFIFSLFADGGTHFAITFTIGYIGNLLDLPRAALFASILFSCIGAKLARCGIHVCRIIQRLVT